MYLAGGSYDICGCCGTPVFSSGGCSACASRTFCGCGGHLGVQLRQRLHARVSERLTGDEFDRSDRHRLVLRTWQNDVAANSTLRKSARRGCRNA